MRRKLAAGNWKMNGTRADLAMLRDLAAAHPGRDCDILICPPALLLFEAAEIAGTGPVQVGAQDCHAQSAGAHTGDISATMIAETGATYVIVGHSERRGAHGETDAQVLAKAQAAQAAGLIAIVCLGETLAQREAGKALAVIEAQLAGSVPDSSTAQNLVVAYEPIWAIGTGKVARPSDIAEVHMALRAQLKSRFGAETGAGIRLLYGGSVKAENAADIFDTRDVDGALVGGASLSAADFSPIVRALCDAD